MYVVNVYGVPIVLLCRQWMPAFCLYAWFKCRVLSEVDGVEGLTPYHNKWQRIEYERESTEDVDGYIYALNTEGPKEL